ncbi:MAG: LysM peptidoglycan-binding domain-containing protein [Candidatus Margulisiibacteriota bacterium]
MPRTIDIYIAGDRKTPGKTRGASMSKVSGINTNTQNPTLTSGSRRNVSDLPSESERAQTWSVYKVKEGDTIKSVAKEFDVPRSQIRRSNGLKILQKLISGSHILIPGERPSAKQAGPVAVQQPELFREDLPPTKVPYLAAEKSPASEEAKPAPVEKENNVNVCSVYKYAVQKNDSIDKIAKKFGMEKKQINSLNPQAGGRIYPGDIVLVTPGSASPKKFIPGKISYHVWAQAGDTVDSLASRFSGPGLDITAQDIIDVNALKEEEVKNLREGQYLLITKVTVEGDSSWYGPGFYGRNTASGQKYMGQPGCACNFLPLGSKITLTNPENGKQTTVEVNDRGDFDKYNRLFDVSRDTVNELGFRKKGVTRLIGHIEYIKKREDLPMEQLAKI